VLPHTVSEPCFFTISQSPVIFPLEPLFVQVNHRLSGCGGGVHITGANFDIVLAMNVSFRGSPAKHLIKLLH